MEKQNSKDLQIESEVIGSLLQKLESPPEIMEILKPDDFFISSNKAIYQAAIELYLDNQIVDILSIKTLSYVDGIRLSELLDTLPGNPINIAKQVKENALNRWTLGYIKSQIGKTPLTQIIETLTNFNITEGIERDTRQPDIASILKRFKSLQQQNTERGSLGIPTGFEFLEKNYIQWVLGHLVVISGFTSVGTTFLFIEMLVRLFKISKSRVVIFSTEMKEEQIISRILANLTGFNSNVILSGNLHDRNQQRLEPAIEWLQEQNLVIYDNVFSLPEITTRIKKAEQQAGVDIVFVDYLQNFNVPGTKDIYTEQSRLIKSLQQEAKLSRCCIIALRQISNSAAREENGILEFKGAGEIAATADLALKPNRYKDNEKNMLVSIGKGRHRHEHSCQNPICRFSVWSSLPDRVCILGLLY